MKEENKTGIWILVLILIGFVTLPLVWTNLRIEKIDKNIKTYLPQKIIQKEVHYVPERYYRRDEINDFINATYENREAETIEKLAGFYATLIPASYYTTMLAVVRLYPVPIHLFIANIRIESNWDEKAKSEKGALGLGQLSPKWFPEYTKAQLYDPSTNLILSARHLLGKYSGSWDSAIYLYNGVGMDALKHQAKVLELEREYDKLFNKEF